MLYCTDCGANGEPQHYNGTSWVNMVGGFALAGPGAITGINCSGATNAVTLTYDEVASGVNSTIAYTGGNGNAHSGQTVASTEVTGLIAMLTARNFAPGAGTLVYNKAITIKKLLFLGRQESKSLNNYCENN